MSKKLGLQEAGAYVSMLSNDANARLAEASQALNAVSILQAIQIGYRMACEQNGLPVPEFADPLKEAGLEGLKQ